MPCLLADNRPDKNRPEIRIGDILHIISVYLVLRIWDRVPLIEVVFSIFGFFY